MSTAYVNCNRKGFIEEKIYELDKGEDPEDVINHILGMNPQHISENEKTIIGNYPNTYTYSKSMAERSLLKNHGKLRISIVRPSIVISSYEEPSPGWTDTLAAGGGITFACGSGLMHYVYAAGSAVVDLVPVDYVSNLILAATSYTAKRLQPEVNVFHSASSNLNPLLISFFREYLLAYTQKNPYYREFSKPHARPIGNPFLFKLLIALTEQIPLKALNLYANSPLGSTAMQEQSKMMIRVQ